MNTPKRIIEKAKRRFSYPHCAARTRAQVNILQRAGMSCNPPINVFSFKYPLQTCPPATKEQREREARIIHRARRFAKRLSLERRSPTRCGEFPVVIFDGDFAVFMPTPNLSS